MNIRSLVAVIIVLVSAIPARAAVNKKNQSERGIVEKMEAVPCGAKQRGISGLGSLWASIGVTHVNSDEKLCPQYLFRTDQTDYEIRPSDISKAVILPVGHEGEFKLKKNRMVLRIVDSPDHKMREYEVVGMNPASTDADHEKSSVDADHDKSSGETTAAGH